MIRVPEPITPLERRVGERAPALGELGHVLPSSRARAGRVPACGIAVIVVVLCATGRWWGLVFVVPLVLDLYLLRRILAAGSSR